MIEVNLSEARRRISELLDRVERGEEVRVRRRGHAPVRLIAEAPASGTFPDLVDFRARQRIPEQAEPVSETVARMRRQERD